MLALRNSSITRWGRGGGGGAAVNHAEDMPLHPFSLLFGAGGFSLGGILQKLHDLHKALKPCPLPAQDQDMLWKARVWPHKY